MRPVERIDNFLQKVDWKWLLHIYWHDAAKQKEEKILQLLPFFKQYWKENPDLRIGQLLISLGFIEDNMKVWLSEEDEILAVQGLSPEDYLFWTSIYDKDGNLLEEPVTRLVKDLESNHIKKILEYCYTHNKSIDNVYYKVFYKILSDRDELEEYPEHE